MPIVRIGGWVLAIEGDATSSSDIVAALRRVYERVGGDGFIELIIHGSREAMETFLRQEARRLGVVVDASFPVVHEAWTGVPRIHVVPRELRQLGNVGKAFLVHEAFHSILHGSLEYYVVTLPSKEEVSWLAAYIAATSIKDLEVHMHMKRYGFREELLLEKNYWEKTLGNKWGCSSPEELGDVLRAATIWIVLGEKPPLSEECSGKIEPLIKLYEELTRLDKRPWNHLDRAISRTIGIVKAFQ